MSKFTEDCSVPLADRSHSGFPFCRVVCLALVWLACHNARAQSATFTLGTAALLEGPSAGADSVVLAVNPNSGAWTAAANASWLHLKPPNQSGTGSMNVVFNYDANPGATRAGTLTIGGQTLTVTQAGSTYVSAGALTPLVTAGSGLGDPIQVAVDGTGNVYIADAAQNALEKWTAANNTLSTLVSGLDLPTGVALDQAGNVYISNDTEPGKVYKWTAANSNLATLISSGLSGSLQLAVDGAGNVYIAGGFYHPMYENASTTEWTAANSNLIQLPLLGVNNAAVDAAGNVYGTTYGETYPYVFDGISPYGGLEEWVAANNTLTQLVTAEDNPLLDDAFGYGTAVDGSGNLYLAVNYSGILKWSAVSQTLTVLASNSAWASGPDGVAVDGARNVYFSVADSHIVEELPYVFVDPTPKLEGPAAGQDTLPVVLPATANLLAPFAPAGDQSWLMISGITNDVVSFAFSANTGASRTAYITLLGQNIPVTQQGVTPPVLTGVQLLGNGVLQFSFTNNPGGSFTVLATTNLSLPLNDWTVAGAAMNIGSGVFQFISPPTTNDAQCFYTVRSP
jgi:hypothetical protein